MQGNKDHVILVFFTNNTIDTSLMHLMLMENGILGHFTVMVSVTYSHTLNNKSIYNYSI